ncbi:hypothetical protein AM337_005643 [Klebsiella pneumoniae]|nr:hypothetical protein AM337_005643 [Klebsiella pneumoniae]
MKNTMLPGQFIVLPFAYPSGFCCPVSVFCQLPVSFERFFEHVGKQNSGVCG